MSKVTVNDRIETKNQTKSLKFRAKIMLFI